MKRNERREVEEGGRSATEQGSLGRGEKFQEDWRKWRKEERERENNI